MDTLTYIKYIVRNGYHGLTPLEQQVYLIYDNYIKNVFMKSTDNFVVDVNKIIEDVNELLKDKSIIMLLFSNGNVKYVEKKILTKAPYFENLMNDTHKTSEINLYGILDSEYMDIVINYLKFNVVLYPKDLKYNLSCFCNIVKVFDYLECSLVPLFRDFMLEAKYEDVSLELLNYIYDLVEKNNYMDTMAFRLFKDNEEKLIKDNGIDKVLESFYFKRYVLLYNGGAEYVVKYKYYDYFVDICDNRYYHDPLGLLVKNKPDNWWKIVDGIYNKLKKNKAYHLDIWLDTNKKYFDMTFFDADINNYKVELIVYIIDKYKCYEKIKLYKNQFELIELFFSNNKGLHKFYNKHKLSEKNNRFYIGEYEIEEYQYYWIKNYVLKYKLFDVTSVSTNIRNYVDEINNETLKIYKIEIAKDMLNYFAVEGYLWMIHKIENKNTMVSKIREFYKDHIELFDLIKPQTKEFIYAVANIKC